MARKNRFAPSGYWLHLTQRGNYRQTVFSSDADREHFLSLLESHSEERGVRIAAYTLMSNHFHLVVVGDRPDAVSLFMMNVNGQYSAYRHAVQKTSRSSLARSLLLLRPRRRPLGHRPPLRRNEPRPGPPSFRRRRIPLVLRPRTPRPHAASRLARYRSIPAPLANAGALAGSLATLTRREAAALRQATRADTALGSDEFISQLEHRYGIQLRPQPLGRPRKPPTADQLRSTVSLAAGALS